MHRILGAAMIAALPAAGVLAQQAGEEADVSEALATCAACHGADGISVSDGIPNLAGQKAGYLENQLKAFRDGKRPSEVMQAIAGQLDDAQIKAIASLFSGLQIADGSARSELLPNLVRADFPFPQDYQASFTKYHTINFPDRKQVRTYFANETALEAAREGRPLPDGSYLLVEIHSAQLDDSGEPVTGEDGFYVAAEHTGFTAMAREAGWGEAVPALLRNENWNYAVMRADGTVNAGANQAACLACHVPHQETSYLFTLDELKEAAGN
jgi:cytochrome c553